MSWLVTSEGAYELAEPEAELRARLRAAEVNDDVVTVSIVDGGTSAEVQIYPQRQASWAFADTRNGPQRT